LSWRELKDHLETILVGYLLSIDILYDNILLQITFRTISCKIRRRTVIAILDHTKFITSISKICIPIVTFANSDNIIPTDIIADLIIQGSVREIAKKTLTLLCGGVQEEFVQGITGITA